MYIKCSQYVLGWNLNIIPVSKIIIIGSDNSSSPGGRKAIIWTNPGILLLGPLGINFSKILIEINTFSLKKCHWKCSLQNGLYFISALCWCWNINVKYISTPRLRMSWILASTCFTGHDVECMKWGYWCKPWQWITASAASQCLEKWFPQINFVRDMSHSLHRWKHSIPFLNTILATTLCFMQCQDSPYKSYFGRWGFSLVRIFAIHMRAISKRVLLACIRNLQISSL